jgi:LysR family transcriptional regulator for bpeEF and oprC
MDWHLIERDEERTIRLRSAILVNDTEAFIACAIAGLGMLQAVRAGVQPHLDAGRLVEVLSHLQVPPRPVSVMYPNRQHLAPQVRVFIDWVSSILGGQTL